MKLCFSCNQSFFFALASTGTIIPLADPLIMNEHNLLQLNSSQC
jgi:hypothetical protein